MSYGLHDGSAAGYASRNTFSSFRRRGLEEGSLYPSFSLEGCGFKERNHNRTQTAVRGYEITAAGRRQIGIKKRRGFGPTREYVPSTPRQSCRLSRIANGFVVPRRPRTHRGR